MLPFELVAMGARSGAAGIGRLVQRWFTAIEWFAPRQRSCCTLTAGIASSSGVRDDDADAATSGRSSSSSSSASSIPSLPGRRLFGIRAFSTEIYCNYTATVHKYAVLYRTLNS
jgi:hypothetical protein